MTSAAKTSTSTRRRLPTHRPPTHSGEMLLEEFRLNTVVKGRRGVTADTALRLAALTGMDAGFWMGLQADYDLWHAQRNVDLSRIKPLAKAS